MKLIFEKLFPYVFGVLAAVSWHQLQGDFPTDKDLLGATLGVSGIFVGFLSTSKAILMSMSSPLLDDLKKSKYIAELVSYIGQAIWSNLIFCAVCVLGYFVAQRAPAFGTAWIFMATVAMFTFVRVTHIMLKIFKHG